MSFPIHYLTNAAQPFLGSTSFHVKSSLKLYHIYRNQAIVLWFCKYSQNDVEAHVNVMLPVCHDFLYLYIKYFEKTIQII